MSGTHSRNESTPILTPAALERAVNLRDLTDPAQGPHALQLLLDDITRSLVQSWGSRLHVHRAPPVVSLTDNYDALGYPPDGASRDARYTRYASRACVLRTQTSAMIPGLLRARAPHGAASDELLVCPGLVYRRDRIDRHHVGEPHQLDLWRLRRARPLDRGDLDEMIRLVVDAALPGAAWRALPTQHPYTQDGLEIEVNVGGSWLEIGECGLAHPQVLRRAGVDDETVSGLAMGLGLDRLLMVRKGIDDIRLLRSEDPRVASQMNDLGPYREVSDQPAMRRDLSLVVERNRTSEELGDRLRERLSAGELDDIEEMEVLEETSYADLPAQARARLGIDPAQKNVLLRLTLRPIGRTLTAEEGNELRDRAYAALHEGAVAEWARH